MSTFYDTLLDQLKAFNSIEESHDDIDDVKRRQLILACRKASLMLENPFESMQRVVYSPFTLITLRSAHGYEILSSLAQAKVNGTSCKVGTIAEQTGLEQGVLLSIFDHLCSQFVCEEIAPGEYVGTILAVRLNSTTTGIALPLFNDVMLPSWMGFFDSLTPGESRTGCQIAFKTSDNFYQWLYDPSHANRGRLMHHFLEAQFQDIPSWLDEIDFIPLYASDAREGDVVFVDVGAGNGQVCQKLTAKVPNLVGKIIHQDLAGPLENAPKILGVDKMVYDYFTEQPVKGARIYYFRQIFHNNSDAKCVAILNNQRSALEPGSVLLIDDKVLKDDDLVSQGYTSALSLSMYNSFRSLERKRWQWLKLLEQGNFEVKDFRWYTAFGDCIITAVPKASPLDSL